MAGAGEVMPSGEALRRALRWCDEQVRDDPKRDRAQVVGEAAMRFDLTPLEADFLLTSWVRPK
jgi:hypothetical protein